MMSIAPSTPVPVRVADPAVERAAGFVDRLFPRPRAFAVRLWEGTEMPGDGAAGCTLVLRTPGALRRMFRLPVALSLGEAYLRGDFEMEGDVWEFAPGAETSLRAFRTPREALHTLRRWWALPRDRGRGVGHAGARIGARARSRAWDREGIRYHYDAGNDFYRLFLDRRMVYSCAYFPTGTEELDAAQEHKLEHVCRKLRLREGERLLDIGCGWGALVIHAAQRHGVRAVGVTLSEEQHAEATRRAAEAGVADRVEIRLQDYRDVRDGPFDKIASVGMFEHVGPARLPEYFAHAYRLLRPRGLFLNHGIGSGVRRRGPGWKAALASALERRLVGSAEFRRRYVFPNGGLVPVSEANVAAERAGFEVRDVENLREHYARTLRIWAHRLEASREEAIRAAGEPLYRLRRIHAGFAAWQFDAGHLTLNQTLLEKTVDGRSELPPSRADLYA